MSELKAMYDELSNKLQTEYVTVVCLVAEAICSIVDCASGVAVDFEWEPFRMNRLSFMFLTRQIGRL